MCACYWLDQRYRWETQATITPFMLFTCFEGQLIAFLLFSLLVLAGWRLDRWWQKWLPGWPPHGHVRATTPSGYAVHSKHAPAGTANPSESHSWSRSGGISVSHSSACHGLTSYTSIINSVSITEQEVKQSRCDFSLKESMTLLRSHLHLVLTSISGDQIWSGLCNVHV